jgi:branched-subunit amino acid transport protein AzlD
MKLSMAAAFYSSLLAAGVIFSTRVFPFILFSGKDPPAILKFIEKYIPPMVMAILLAYCLKDIHLSSEPYGLPHFAALAGTVLLHLWKKNAMLSIFGGTIFFMIMNRIC